MAGKRPLKIFFRFQIKEFQVFRPVLPVYRLLPSNQEELPTAIPSTVFFVATKRCMYGGTELPVES